MTTKTTISISEGRKRLFEVAENVQSLQTIFTFTEKGKPKVVMMSAENFESWAETLEITYLFPHLKRDMKETREAINDKSYKKWATFEKVFPEVITKQKKSLVKSTIKSVAKKKAQGKSKK